MSQTKIRPLGNRLVVQKIEVDAVSNGGIVLTGDKEEKQYEGIVVDVAPDVQHVTEGERVLFGQYVGQEVEVDGTPYLILTEDEIIAILV